MRTLELLDMYPELSRKRLREWMDSGFLVPERLEGRGQCRGTGYDYCDENVARIKLILANCDKRIDKDRIRVNLLARGAFLYNKQTHIFIDQVINRMIQQYESKGFTSYSRSTFIGLVTNAVMTKPSDKKSLALQNQYCPVKVQRQSNGMLGLFEYYQSVAVWGVNPLADMLSMCNVYNVSKMIEGISEAELFTVFKQAEALTILFTPIVAKIAEVPYEGNLIGWGELGFHRDQNMFGYGKINIEVTSLLAVMRVMCTVGLIIAGKNREEITKKRNNFLSHNVVYEN